MSDQHDSESERREMSPSHKQAMVAGTEESRKISAYLELYEKHRPRKGRKVSKEELQSRLEEAESEIETASHLKKVQLMQACRDLKARIEALENTGNLKEAEDAFVKVVKSYSTRHGIEYDTWREYGVPAKVLKSGGMGGG